MTTLMQANNAWANRGADERFASVADLHAAAVADRANAAGGSVATKDLRVVASNGAVKLAAKDGRDATISNWAFGQLSTKIGAPAAYLRTLPAELAADCLNNGLKSADDERSQLLLKKFAGVDSDLPNYELRALTSDRYSRIWNADITSRLLELEERGPWQPAPAAFDGSRGLYLSDRDMFAFMVDNERRIFEKQEGGLSRGFFISNSETGAASFSITCFYYEYVCGNHRVWGASNVKELRMRHVGGADLRAMGELRATLIKYAEGSARDDEAKITACREYSLGNNKDEVLDAVMGLRVPLISQKLVRESYALAEQREDWYGNPRSAWGMMGALTEIARDKPNADERVALERAGSKVMEMAW